MIALLGAAVYIQNIRLAALRHAAAGKDAEILRIADNLVMVTGKAANIIKEKDERIKALLSVVGNPRIETRVETRVQYDTVVLKIPEGDASGNEKWGDWKYSDRRLELTFRPLELKAIETARGWIFSGPEWIQIEGSVQTLRRRTWAIWGGISGNADTGVIDPYINIGIIFRKFGVFSGRSVKGIHYRVFIVFKIF